MKKIYYITLGVISSLIFTSCSGFLDKEPSTELSDDGAITSVSDLQNAVNGVGYILVGQRMTYTSEYQIYGDLLTNDFTIIDDYGQSSPITQYTLTKNDELPDDAYKYYYQALANTNKAIKGMSNIEVTSDNKSTVDNLHGELLAWRGLLHFDLARMFCHIPTAVSDLDKANSGLVLSDTVYEPTFKGTRSTLKETYNYIIKNFTDALSLLSKDKNTGYINYYAALALRARAYLYMGDYSKALADANEVINSGEYKLYTIDNYASAWDKEGTDESIFEILTTDAYNADRYSTGYYTDASGYPECALDTTSALFKYLEGNTSDVRSSMIKDQTDTDEPGYYPAKYPGRNGSIYVNNPKIIRLSEVYLIAAEASYYVSGGAAAASYINAIDEKRITGYTDVASVTIDDILFEYEKEMFAENQIAFAYWRNKKSVTNFLGDVINYDNDRTVLPIPQREIDYNSAIIQNAGY